MHIGKSIYHNHDSIYLCGSVFRMINFCMPEQEIENLVLNCMS